MGQEILVNILSSLISKQSITPDDAECQLEIKEHLSKLDFQTDIFHSDKVTNLLSIKGSSAPLFIFAGHTDVVDPGPLDNWNTPPFQPTIINNKIYGRGAADMKGSIAAMLLATKEFCEKFPQHNGSIGFFITSGEEGDQCAYGTPKILEKMAHRKIDFCIVGEPTSNKKIGDTIKIGRRGSLTAELTIHGKGGHIAYPELCDNPMIYAAHAISALNSIKWDDEDDNFSATSLQFSNIFTDNNSGNIIPHTTNICFNLRYNSNTTPDEIKDIVKNTLEKLNISYKINWQTFGLPYISKKDALRTIAANNIEKIKNYKPSFSTTGGTSDARYIAHYSDNIIELGPQNATIHKPNENIGINDLVDLKNIYYSILKTIFIDNAM